LVHFFKPGGAKGNRRKDNPGKQFLQLIALYILKTKSGIEKAKRNYLETSILDSILIFCNAHGFSTTAVEMGN